MKISTAMWAVAMLGLGACAPGPSLESAQTGAARRAEPLAPPISEGHGFNIHFTDPKPGEMEMIAASGVKWVRMDFHWASTERQPGQYDFSAYDRLMASLEAHGIRALFILDYGNKLYDGGQAPCTDAGRAAFARWAAAAVTHFKGRGVLWEMWNEPNIGFWKPEPNVTNYVALARAVGAAIRAAAPDEAYCGPGTSRIDLEFIEECFRGGLLEDWSAVTVHPYRHQSGPETVVPEYGRLRDLIDRYAPKGKTIPIISGEWGFSAAWTGFDAVSQGDMLARQWLVNAACDIPLSIWYDWHDDGRDPKEAEHNFGTVSNTLHSGRTPVYDSKPAYLAAATLNRELAGFRFDRRLSVARVDGTSSPEDWVLVFRKGGETRLAAWTTAAPGATVRLPVGAGPVKVLQHTGEARSDLAAGADGVAIDLTGHPVYLAPAGAVSDRAGGHWDWSDGRLASVVLLPVGTGSSSVRVEKAYGAPFRGRVVTSADGKDLAAVALDDLPAGAATLNLSLFGAVPAGIPVALRVERSDGAVVFSAPPRRLAPLADFASAPYALHANDDGKGKVASTQTIARAEVPAGLVYGGGAVRVTLGVETGYKYFCVVPTNGADAAIDGRPTALALWVHARGGPCSIGCRVQDARGEVFQSPAQTLAADSGWTYVELPLATARAGHWGGNNDGIPDLPWRWQALLLIDRNHGRPCNADLHFAHAALVYEP